jgi:fumarate hydratase class II
MPEQRDEKDSMGTMQVPAAALYGASTQRAVLNFPISGIPVERAIIHAYGLIKAAAAAANAELGELPAELTDLIETAAREIAAGDHDKEFPVDTYQTGSGTSTNMNVNEVISNRCSQLAGKPPGSQEPVHPNDHANHGQSSNDTFPSAIHVAAARLLDGRLIPALEGLHHALAAKAEEFHPVLKIGRTHLMDATPMRLGQEFSGYATQAGRAAERARQALAVLLELPLGGTAIGTGLNRHPDFPERAIARLAADTRLPFRRASNPFEAQASRDSIVEAHGQLNTIAVSLFKVAGDIRLLASGPRCALGEITLPATQPGSSIMPGKVNPVMCEALAMVAARVFGNQATITWGGANGHFELNTFMPVMAMALLESINLLAGATTAFTEKCVSGITANSERCAELIELSLSMVTSLAPVIGYAKAAGLAKQAMAEGRTVREVCEEQREVLGLSPAQLNALLDPATMTGEG